MRSVIACLLLVLLYLPASAATVAIMGDSIVGNDNAALAQIGEVLRSRYGDRWDFVQASFVNQSGALLVAGGMQCDPELDGRIWDRTACSDEGIGYPCVSGSDFYIVPAGWNDIAVMQPLMLDATGTTIAAMAGVFLRRIQTAEPQAKILWVFVHPCRDSGSWSRAEAVNAQYEVYRAAMQILLAAAGVPCLDIYGTGDTSLLYDHIHVAAGNADAYVNRHMSKVYPFLLSRPGCQGN